MSISELALWFLFTTHDNLIRIGVFLEIDRFRLKEAQPFVIDRNISAIDAGPVPGSSDDRYQRAVEDLVDITLSKPFMNALHRLVIGVLVDCQNKLRLPLGQTIAMSNDTRFVRPIFVMKEAIAPKIIEMFSNKVE
jgi:hypothetical protein